MPVIQTITSASGTSAFVPTSRQLTINGVTYDLTADRSWTIEVLDNLIATAPLSYDSGTNTISISQASNTTDGYLSSADWLTFSSKQPAITLTTTGNSGASTFNGITGALNIPEYTLIGLGGFANPMTTLGDLIIARSTGEPFRFGGNSTTTRKYLSQIGDGTSVVSSSWEEISTTTLNAVPTSRTITINGTAFDLSANRTWDVGTITSLTGEATASGSGAVSVTLTNSAVIGKVLTGLNVTGGTIVATDSILTAFGKIQNQVNGLIGGVIYRGTWNATTNTPTIVSGGGSKGDYYIVNVAGTTNVDGINDWQIGDWIIFNGTTWDKVDNTDSVSSVNGFTGAVSLTTANISEVTNLYYTDARSRSAISLTTTGSSGASTYNNTTGVFNIPEYTLTGLGGVPSTRTITINGTTLDLSANRTFNVGTVTSVGLTMPVGFSVASSPITSSGTIAVTLSSGYLIPTTAQEIEWNEAYTNRITSLTTTGNSGVATLVSNTLNIPEYTLAGLGGFANPMTTIGDIMIARSTGEAERFAGNITTTRKYFSQIGNGTAVTSSSWEEISATTLNAVPTSRTITINGTSFNLSADRSWSVGTVTSVSALTIGTTGTDITSSVANGTTTPVITLNIPTASSVNRGALSSTDWSTFNSKEPAITAGTTTQYYRGDKTFQTLNTTAVTEGTNLYYTDTRARLSISETITGIDYNNSTGVFSTTSGYGIPTTAKQTEWDTAYTNRITSLTTTGSSGAATLISNTLNIPNYTAAGLGAVPTSRTITINDVVFDLSSNREWSVGDFGTW